MAVFWILFLVSVVAGLIVFVSRLGPDDWLLKGLRDDKIAPVVVMCLLVILGILLFFSLIFLLRVISGTIAIAFARAVLGMPVEEGQRIPTWDVVNGLLLLGAPVVSGYLLYLLYQVLLWVCWHTSSYLSSLFNKDKLLYKHSRHDHPRRS